MQINAALLLSSDFDLCPTGASFNDGSMSCQQEISTVASGAIMRYLALVLLALDATTGTLQAQTMIPSLDEPGRKSDLARAAKQRSATQFDATD